ncbi:hypothetical protein INS49_014781 [Diaporthe citri]|uniref:uncharacterized protein n=1 Tax=Diaporthe citri TaxID=83186 RepID=UPI001C8197B2|nr:uncharacterized protein INS49_014781 [Diaporthe citri]KAG6356906.1 hypothetical protein INS49_014781 [Diaporthe citri]
MSGIVALADLGSNAVDLFRKVEKALKESADTAWPDDLLVAESERFELWAANMGLFVAGHGSLDYRVREAERLAQTLRRFMQDLINSLDDVFQLCSGVSQEGASGMDESSGKHSETERTRDEGEDEDGEEGEEIEMELLLDGVRDPINRLFKVSTKIRNPSTRLGSSRATNYRQIDEDTGVDFLEAIKEADLDYVSSIFLEYRKVRACEENHPAEPPGGPSGENDDAVWEPIRTVLIQEQERQRTGVNSYLIERIAQANGRRRQQFAYWARHRDKLDKHTKSYQAQKTQFRTAQPHRAGEYTPGAVTSVTTATRLDVARLEVSDNLSSWTLSEYAPSTRQAAHAPVDFPPAPKRSRNTPSDKFFECPYCFFLCPKEILADKAWKAHLIHDLRPYICTYEDCKNPTQLYDSRQDWVQHENSEHRKVWRCLEHSDQVFKTLEPYKRHLQGQHRGSISGEASSIRIIQASESVSDILGRACPICMVELDTTRAMESHIALHLERFARFSLPRSVINDDDGSNADSDRANRVEEEGSRDDDFEGGFELHSDIDASEAQVTGHPSESGCSSTPHGVETTEGILQAFQPFDDDDDLSSEIGQAQHEVQQTTEDEASSDDFEVGKWCTDPEKYNEVERSYREAVEQSEKTLGREHPDTLERMSRLSLLLFGQMKYEDAEQIDRESLERREKVLGREHPHTLDSMHQLGASLSEQNKNMESEQVERETAELREKVLGREHPRTLSSIFNLALTLYKMGRYEESEELNVEVLETRKRTLGHAHRDTLTSMNNLGLTLGKLGKLEESERLFAQATEMSKQELGSDHPNTVQSMFNMAGLFWDQARFEEAEKLDMELSPGTVKDVSLRLSP